MGGPGSGEYAALAFSDDDSMGDDLVFACVRRGNDVIVRSKKYNVA